MYQVHSIDIRKEDKVKADEILLGHLENGDMDDVSITIDVRKRNGDNLAIATYWIKAYLYEDFETIKNEFKLAGIQTL